jgi:predicted tellurium resistance membrane protein TerC
MQLQKVQFTNIAEEIRKNKSPVYYHTKKSTNFHLAIFWLYLLSVVASIDSIIMASALPKIAQDLQAISVQVF